MSSILKIILGLLPKKLIKNLIIKLLADWAKTTDTTLDDEAVKIIDEILTNALKML